MGKFFNGKVIKGNQNLIKYAIIAGGVLVVFVLIIIIAANAGDNIAMKDKLRVEVNSEAPEKLDYVKDKKVNASKISVDDNDLMMSKVGTYTVKVIAGKNRKNVKVKVVDTTAPEVELKSLTIGLGDDYEAKDFITTCKDNSKTDCIIEFYEGEDGKYVFDSYSLQGTYKIQLIAKDESDNISKVLETTLQIGEGSAEVIEPTKCEYGGLIPDSSYTYPIATYVGDLATGCAENKDNWKNTDLQVAANEIYDADYAALQEEIEKSLKKKYPDGGNVNAKPTFKAVINKQKKGLIGYAIYVEVTVESNGKTDTILKYYINENAEREYEYNGLK